MNIFLSAATCLLFLVPSHGSAAPANKACPSWVTNPSAYRYSAEDWGGDAKYGDNNKVMVVGLGKFAGAKTTACIWVANCKGNDECIRNCPIAVGAAYEESMWHPRAQSYDGIGRGLYQWGGASAPSCARKFVGKECNVVYNGGTFTAVPGSGPQATVADCSAYNPVLNTQRTIPMTGTPVETSLLDLWSLADLAGGSC